MVAAEIFSSNDLVLPNSTRALIEATPVGRRHPGLQLDKLCGVGDMGHQRKALDKVIRTAGDPGLLEALRQRRDASLAVIGADKTTLTTRGPLTAHLSQSGVLENAGISLHRLYGFVFLPGTGLKGMARAWAETAWAPVQADPQAAWRRIEEAFGWSTNSEGWKSGWRPGDIDHPEGSAAGRLVFHDAWPLAWPALEIDIANIHHSQYYAGQDEPGDWDTPTLVTFLIVARGTAFDFPISDRLGRSDGLLELAREWLSAALVFEGAGAKTASGYGRFAAPDAGVSPSIPDSRPSSEFELKLAAPAFLAGLDQGREDCDLRGATLRGLLRWWWRTMHAAHVDRDGIAALETAVWGDAQSGGSVRISVDPLALAEPMQHPDKRDPNFLRQHGISSPGRDRKVTQGLYYASYGMAERGKTRWFRPAGSTWRLSLIFRGGRYKKAEQDISLNVAIIQEQVLCALWLLSRFGGAGSRSRKGFGSFVDLHISGIGSVEDCQAAAARFRRVCGLTDLGTPVLQTATLDEMQVLEQKTKWVDPWYALEQTGMALQLFAKSRSGDERIPLGLPRNIGRPPNHRPLKAGQLTRHASPAHWSLAPMDNGTLTVRLAIFPAGRLPDRETSKTTLEELLAFTGSELARSANEAPRQSQRPPASPSPLPSTPAPSQLVKGVFVNAVLLEEKTRKGGWRAKHEPSGREMAIQNTPEVPTDKQPGDVVELYVFSSDAFQWPTDDVKVAAKRVRTGPPKGGRGPGRR